MEILETAVGYEHPTQLLQSSILDNIEWGTKRWKPYVLETALAVAQKWKNGFE